MIRCLLAVCGESVIRDAASNIVSVINIYDEINAQGFPLLIPKLSCLFLFERNDDDPTEADTTITFTHPTGQLFQNAFQLNFQGRHRLRSMLTLQGFVVPSPGLVKVAVALGGNVLGSWEMIATAVGGPQLGLPLAPAQAPMAGDEAGA